MMGGAVLPVLKSLVERKVRVELTGGRTKNERVGSNAAVYCSVNAKMASTMNRIGWTYVCGSSWGRERRWVWVLEFE
jgi:hypothetical protein